MSVADLILALLEKQNIEFETLRAPDAVSLKEDWLQHTVPLHSVSHVAILQDTQGLVLAFFPADHFLNLDELRTILHRNLSYAAAEDVIPKLIVSLKEPYSEVDFQHGLQIIIDESLTNLDHIHFQAPAECRVIRLRSLDLELLAYDALLGRQFSIATTSSTQSISKPKADIKQRLQKLDRLPAMPDMPSRILAIRNNPNSTVEDLVDIIEKDVSLSAQIMRYSNAAIFNLGEPVVSLKDAIFRVLGYETVLHFSLGYALGRVFKLPQTGPLGHENFWQHSTYSAALVQQLGAAMPTSKRPQPGLTYLCGLLHDIGFLVLNLFFRNEYAWLNKMISASPDKSILETEQRLLGASHMEIGYWLMEAWNMPEEICVTVAQHHNLNYLGPYSEYALLVNLSERLLKMHGMSDSDTDDIPSKLLARLGLDEEQVLVITDEVLQGGDTFKEMAVSVSA